MIKKLSWIIAAMFAVVMVSCGEPEEIKTPTTPIVPGELVENPEAIMRPDVLTPVDYIPNLADGGMDGVTIEVTDKEPTNFKFTIKPGANIQSYRLDVYPLCRLYNALYEQMRMDGMDMKTPLTKTEVEEMIRGFIFDDSGSGAYTFSVDNLEDFLRHEFDWMNSGYAQAKVVPHCEYLIAAVGCFDKGGYEQGDLTICYVHTPYYGLIGDPKVEMEVLTTFNAVQVEYKPNADAKFFYEWMSDQSDLQPYIDTYGEKLYIDFMRNAVYEAASTSDPEALFYYANFGYGASSEIPLMATTIGLDRNQTPAEEFEKEVFSFKARPENAAPAESTITVDEDHLGASVFWVEVEMGANCSATVMKLMTKEQAEAYKDINEAESLVLAMQIYEDGYGFGNTNYAYNRETDELIGSGITLKDHIGWPTNNTEYVIAWTAKNQYQELMPVKFTEPFRTKAIVKDTPAQSEENMEVYLSADDSQNVEIRMTYDFDKVANIHWHFIEGIPTGGVYVPNPNNGATREDYVDFLYEDGDGTSAICYHFYGNPMGVDSWSFVLFPETTYTVACVAEDWNGVLGEVKFATATTKPLEGGSSPQLTITGGEDAFWGEAYAYFFTRNDEAYEIKYAAFDSYDLPSLNQLGKAPVEDLLEEWERKLMELGMTTQATTIDAPLSANLSVGLGMAIGGETSAPIYGPLEVLIHDNGNFYTLDHYYPNMSAVAKPQQVKRTSVGVPSSELPEVEYGKRMTMEEYAAGRQIVKIDHKKLSSHPKAKGW